MSKDAKLSSTRACKRQKATTSGGGHNKNPIAPPEQKVEVTVDTKNSTNAASSIQSLCEMGEAALHYASKGLYVLPPGACSSDVYNATTDLNVIRERWKANPREDVGIAIGASDLIVLSVDEDRGEQSLTVLEDKLDMLPQTVTGIMSAIEIEHQHYCKKRLLVFKGVKNLSSRMTIADGIGAKATGDVLIVAPNHHLRGVNWFVPGHSFDDLAPASLPMCWVHFLQTTAAFQNLNKVMHAKGLVDRHYLSLLIEIFDSIDRA